MNNINDLFELSFILQILPVLSVAFIKEDKKASAIMHFLLCIGLITGFAATFFAVFFPPQQAPVFSVPGLPADYFRLDSLALYFLFIIQVVAIPITIFGYSYLKHYIERGKPVKSQLVFYALMIISTQLVVITNHAILFLVCWEIMSMSAYLGMIFEKEKKEVETGSFYYLIMNHVVMFLLYVFFFLLHQKTDSWLFSDFHIFASAGPVFTVLYLLALTAFGMKSGFMPFHFWLPRAHPIAPTTVSSFLSGIIIKTGIYGILRTFQFLNPAPLWIGWMVLAVSMVTAIYGVWYALAQHDIKKLLAYHSVENIGIIGIGLGIGFLGSACNNIPVQVLGFGGALLHVLNHAVFKSLLFMGSGVIAQNLGTRNIELMGGIVHRARFFVILFLIGSVAICGIPPLNGFVSEFIIYNSFFAAAREFGNYYPLFMLVSAVGLAFVGGLAVACFTKIISIMFLGTERSAAKPFPVSGYEYAGLGIPALLCVIIGFYPGPFLGAVYNVLVHGFVNDISQPELFKINWPYITIIFTLFAVLAAAVYFGRKVMLKKFGTRESDAWGCGYDKITPRMQYTASSFADQINDISRSALGYRKKGKAGQEIIPPAAGFESHSTDIVDANVILRGFNRLSRFVSKFEMPGNTDIRYYVAYLLIMIILYSLAGSLWNL